MKLNRSTFAGKKILISFLGVCLILGSGVAAMAAEAHHVDSGALLKDFLYRILNFVVLFGLLAYFVTKPMRKGMAARREEIEKKLRDSEAARKAAEAKFADYDRKLARASDEIEEIQAAIRREGEMEREKILVNARGMAEKIRKEAEKSAANEIAKARAELRREASRMAVEIAEGILRERLTPEDQARLIQEYSEKVGELH